MVSSPPPFNGLALARSLPEQPGVYRYFDAAGKLLYVGKARNLRKRVASYFQRTSEEGRIRAMVARVARVEFTVVPTEVDALVLENRLIQEGKPVFNIRLKDGGSYPYLHLSTDKAVPQLTVAREKKGKAGRYFGPFPSRSAVWRAHDALQVHFGLRTCSDAFFAHRSRPCLEYQIRRCSGPCVGLVSPEDYAGRVRDLTAFLEGRGQALVEALAGQMETASAALDFEKAAALRDRIASLRHVQSRVSVEQGTGSFDAVAVAQEGGLACASIVSVRDGQVVEARAPVLPVPWQSSDAQVLGEVVARRYLSEGVPLPARVVLANEAQDQAVLAQALAGCGIARVEVGARGADAAHLALARRNAQAGLEAALVGQKVGRARWEAFAALAGLDPARFDQADAYRVECLDISHTMGQATVASDVVFGPQGPRRALYRRYNIAGITPGDDFAAMRQAVERRLTGGKEPPDVLVIDGGAGQVAQAVAVARGLNFDFPIVGLAKGPERIGGKEDVLLDDGRRVIHPGPHDPALLYLRAVRDEAHRFAVAGHRRRREKAGVASVLETIPGVGPKRRQALLAAFGGLQGLKQASREAIARVPGIGPDLAEQVVLALR